MRLRLTCLVAAVLLTAAGCRPRDRYFVNRLPSVDHVVVFWLKEPGNQDHRQRIIDASYRFRSIPGVLGVEAGPVLESPRANVDKTYDVATVIRLRHVVSLEEYQSHPLHQRMLQEVGPLVDRVVVYDFTYRPPARKE